MHVVNHDRYKPPPEWKNTAEGFHPLVVCASPGGEDAGQLGERS